MTRLGGTCLVYGNDGERAVNYVCPALAVVDNFLYVYAVDNTVVRVWPKSPKNDSDSEYRVPSSTTILAVPGY